MPQGITVFVEACSDAGLIHWKLALEVGWLSWR